MKEKLPDKDFFDDAVKLLTKELGGTPLAERAAHALAFGWNQGYCDYTESLAVYELLKPLTCSWCGRLHRCYSHNEQSEDFKKEQEKAKE